MSAILDREEYIEQAYAFRSYRERLESNVPAQEILATIGEEVLTTTKLPLALSFLKGEILLTGKVSDGMKRLSHYFTPFQSYIMARAEEERSRFDQKTALLILERQAQYMAANPIPAGLFVFQFECVARNRLGYHLGMKAIAEDPLYDSNWHDWILKTRNRLGSTDFADLIYYRSEHYVNERKRRTRKGREKPSFPILFGVDEGRIAKANRGKDPLFMFSALQRHLGHPAVPRARPAASAPPIHPALEQRLQRIEAKLKIMESEIKDEFDLSEFYIKPEDIGRDGDDG
ncbi:MAG: hypothetical protein AB7O26_04245 [Planctomycetaceae bacterium]